MFSMKKNKPLVSININGKEIKTEQHDISKKIELGFSKTTITKKDSFYVS